MDSVLVIKCERSSPFGYNSCSQQMLDDTFSRAIYSDFNSQEDYLSDKSIPEDLDFADNSSDNVSPCSGDKIDICSSTLSDLDDEPKRVCLVCGDSASGYHYGVSSCEACKAFFKRTIQGNIEYSCPASGDCEITKRRRKACQACRFQKCLNVGMLREGVRLDRVRGGRQKYKRSPEQQMVQSPPLTKKLYVDTDNSLYLSMSNGLFVDEEEDNYHSLKESYYSDNRVLCTLLVTESQLDKLLALPDPSMPEDEIKFMSVLSDLADRELVITISWAKQVPGFTSLSLTDQMNLLQHSWLEILCLNLCYRSSPYSGYLRFAQDFSISESDATIYMSNSELDSLTRKLAKKMTALDVSREEYVILKALLLCNPDSMTENNESVKNIQDKITDALIDYIKTHQGGNMRRLGHLFLIMPMIVQVKLLAKKCWFDVQKDGRILMHKLFLEMLEAAS